MSDYPPPPPPPPPAGDEPPPGPDLAKPAADGPIDQGTVVIPSGVNLPPPPASGGAPLPPPPLPAAPSLDKPAGDSFAPPPPPGGFGAPPSGDAFGAAPPPGFGGPPSGDAFGAAPAPGFAPPPGYAPPGAAPGYPAPVAGYGAPVVAPVVVGVPVGYVQKDKLTAGLLGIFLGGFGVHNFYLGKTGIAVAQLVIGLFTCFTVTYIWGLIEGIMILTGSINTDGNGVPLKG